MDLTKSSSELDEAIETIKQKTLTWLDNIGVLERNWRLSLTTESKDEIKKLIVSNKILIHHAQKARVLLNLQKERMDQRKKTASLFHDDFLSLSMDASNLKCKFSFNPKLFLTDDQCSVKVVLPEQLSYTLGTRNNEKAIIGPLKADTTEKGSPRLTTNILHANQLLPCNVSVLPKAIHLITDVLSTQSRDMWLRETKFNDFNLILTMGIDDQTVSNKMISKTGDDVIFHKLRKIDNVLDRFHVKVLDHNLRKLTFASRAYTKIMFVIRPIIVER